MKVNECPIFHPYLYKDINFEWPHDRQCLSPFCHLTCYHFVLSQINMKDQIKTLKSNVAESLPHNVVPFVFDTPCI